MGRPRPRSRTGIHGGCSRAASGGHSRGLPVPPAALGAVPAPGGATPRALRWLWAGARRDPGPRRRRLPAVPALKSGGGSGAAPAAALPARPGMGSAHSVPAEMRELADRTGCEYRGPAGTAQPSPEPRGSGPAGDMSPTGGVQEMSPGEGGPHRKCHLAGRGAAGGDAEQGRGTQDVWRMREMSLGEGAELSPGMGESTTG